VIAARLFWIAVAIAIALLAALFFNRFDPARERGRRTKADKQEKKKAEVIPTGLIPTQSPGSIGLTTPRLTPLVPAQRRFNFARILLAELRLLRKELHWRSFLVAVALVIAGALLPIEIARQYILPFTWLWPILVWSALGTREARHHTAGMVFSAAHPLGRQLPAIYAVGVVVTALTGSGVAFNFLRAGDLASLSAWVVAALFIPSLAIALAVWSGGSKLFEVVYLALWYAGPMNQFLPQLDFIGASDQAASSGTPLIFLVATVVLMGMALIGRQRQLRG